MDISRATIGRETQIENLRTAIGRIVTGTSGPNVLLVTGEAGIGKSTLLAKLPELARCYGTQPIVELVACSTPVAGSDVGGMEALAPWAELMSRLTTNASATRHDSRTLVAELAAAWIPCLPVVGDVLDSIINTSRIIRGQTAKGLTATQTTSQQQVFQQYINFLEQLSARVPLVLAIDDAHWADASSMNLLFAAARKLHGRPVLFVVAYRPDDAASSGGGEGHPILHIRGELDRYSLTEEIGVPRLGGEAIVGMLRGRYPHYESNREFEEWIARASGGNALFVTQFIATLAEDGHISPDGRINDGYESVAIPESAAAVVRERIRRVDRDLREMLAYASVEGDVFTLAVLAAVTELPQLKLLQKLRLVQETHQIIRSLGKRRIYAAESTAYEFEHALVQRALYEMLEAEEREMLHAAILEVLKEELAAARESSAGIEPLAPRLAAHARACGDMRLAAEVLLEGAREAWHRWSESEALAMIDEGIAALGELGPTSASDVRLGRLLLLRGNIHRNRGRGRDALGEYARARAILAAAGADEEANTAWAHGAMTHLNLGETEEAERIAGEVLSEAGPAGFVDGWLIANRVQATLLHIRGHYDEAVVLREAACEFVREHRPDSSDDLMEIVNLAIELANAGRTEEARSRYERALSIARESGETYIEANVLLNLGQLNSDGPDRATAIAMFERSRELCRALGDEWTEGFVIGNLAAIHRNDGELDLALVEYERALEIARRCEDRYLEGRMLVGRGTVHLALGDCERASEHFRESLAIAEATDDHYCQLLALVRLGEATRRSGDLEGARAHLERGIASAGGVRDTVVAVALEAELALLEAEESRRFAGAERVKRLSAAREHIADCLERFREADHYDQKRWERELGLLDAELQVAASS